MGYLLPNLSLGTSYIYPIKEDERPIPIENHNRVVLTYGEYVPVSVMMANEVYKETGRITRTLVVDYNTLVPRDRRLIEKLLGRFENIPEFLVASQENEAGFGTIIEHDLHQALKHLNPVRIQTLKRVYGMNEWGTDHLTHPNIEELRRSLLGMKYEGENKPAYVKRHDPTPSGFHNMRIR